jgi:hypothetical protein
MMPRRFIHPAFALLTCSIMALLPRQLPAVDATFLSSSNRDSKETLPYDVEYAAAAREMGTAQDTPEADARPGEYYFLRGVRAFQKKDYEFAIQMYEVAASWAYKPAEYNLAVMYARGQGIPADLPRGMAWMALAAERNEQHYVDAREAVYAEMTKEQFDQANVIWRELKKTYGDEVALRRAKARWAEVRSRVTGSHVGAVGNLVVSSPSGSTGAANSPNNPTLIGPIQAHERETRIRQGGSNIKGLHVNSAGPTTPGEVTGAHGVDGSIAYRHLQESDNPYDPKFNSTIGRARVGPPTTVTPDTSNKKTEDKTESLQHDQ